jgi:hypothetical protein
MNSAGFSARNSFGSLVYDNKMWVMGGWNGSMLLSDVWNSNNGTSWVQVTSTAGFGNRVGFGNIVYNNEMWVIGGETNTITSAAVNDVWSSSDGVTWAQVTGTARFSARQDFGSLVYNNAIWVIGGTSNGTTGLNDVWSSSDGVTWTQVTGTAGFSSRDVFGSLVYNNQMWVIGGDNGSVLLNDVWSSSDGATWTQVTSTAGFSSRMAFGNLIYNNKMWVIGGLNYNMGDVPLDDVWNSNDGKTWTQATPRAGFSGRYFFGNLAYSNKMWVIGGYNGSVELNDVWWAQ